MGREGRPAGTGRVKGLHAIQVWSSTIVLEVKYKKLHEEGSCRYLPYHLSRPWAPPASPNHPLVRLPEAAFFTCFVALLAVLVAVFWTFCTFFSTFFSTFFAVFLLNNACVCTLSAPLVWLISVRVRVAPKNSLRRAFAILRGGANH
jgi:hypothetical protein